MFGARCSPTNRMTGRIRQHVNPLKLEFVAGRGARFDFPIGREIEVELGCADACFLFERAAADRTRYYVGLEIRADFIDRVNRRARDEGLPLQAMLANVNADLPGLFPPSSIARFYLNFPDPWFKRRHHKRRVLTPTLVATLATQLVSGGELFFQSDVFDLALDAMEVLEDAALLCNAQRPWSFVRENPFRSHSKRERQTERRGRRVWRLWYRRVAQ
jgi:tRNA (guanine-N7-)-methyltransferase